MMAELIAVQAAAAEDGGASALSWLGQAFSDWKELFEASIGFHNDALHVLAGVLLHFAAALLLRSSLNRPGPWLVVLVLELLNEANDFFVEVWPADAAGRQLGEGLKDVILTLAVPTVIFLFARYYPRLLTGGRVGTTEPSSAELRDRHNDE